MSEFRGAFTPDQREQLLQPIRPHRVHKDQDGKSYMEGYEVTAHLNRIFGFEGWDKEIIRLEVVYESTRMDEKKGRDGWWVAYRCEMRLTLFDGQGVKVKVIEDAAVASSDNMPQRADAHHNAMTSAITTALKRCSKDLGDQFGLSLYNKGSMNALVQKVIPYGSDEEPEAAT